jgi:hypothetical protein
MKIRRESLSPMCATGCHHLASDQVTIGGKPTLLCRRCWYALMDAAWGRHPAEAQVELLEAVREERKRE